MLITLPLSLRQMTTKTIDNIRTRPSATMTSYSTSCIVVLYKVYCWGCVKVYCCVVYLTRAYSSSSVPNDLTPNHRECPDGRPLLPRPASIHRTTRESTTNVLVPSSSAVAVVEVVVDGVLRIIPSPNFCAVSCIDN